MCDRTVADLIFSALVAQLDLQTLVAISVGDWSGLGEQVQPREPFCRWLRQADLRQLRGVLLAALECWHERRQLEAPEI